MEKMRIKAYENAEVSNLPEWYLKMIYDIDLSENRVYKLSRVNLTKNEDEQKKIRSLVEDMVYKIKNDNKLATLLNIVKDGEYVGWREGLPVFMNLNVEELNDYSIADIMERYSNIVEGKLMF